LIVDTVGWRWIFFVNLPLAALALVAIWVAMPRGARRHERSIDWVGAAVLAAGSTALLLGLVWGGHEFAWSSGEVIGVLGAAGVLLAAFWLVERRVGETILPFAILRQRTAGVATLALALLGMTILGTIVYVPLFVQGVLDRSATSSGVIVVPFMLSAVCASVASGWWVSRTGRYKVNAVVGLAVLASGLLLVWRMDEATGGGEVARNAVVAGLGVGLAMQVLIVAVQNTVALETMGSATALVHFSRSIGGTLGVTVMGAIATRDLRGDPDVRGPLPEHLPLFVRHELAVAVHPAFLFAACVCLAALVLVVFGLREEPLRRSVEEQPVESML
jgi:MFS family permease